MGAGGSHVWTEASWDEAIKQEGLLDSLGVASLSSSNLTNASLEEKTLLTSTSRMDKLFLSQVAGQKDAGLEDVHRAIELVIGYANSNSDDPRSGVLLCRALHAICVLGVGGKHRKSCQLKIMKAGGLAMIVEVLKRKESILAQRHSLAALSVIICRNLSAERMAIDLDVIDACSTVMKEAAINADTTGSGELAVIAERGCLLFTSLCAGNPEGKTALLKKSGCLVSILDAMEAFLPAAAVQLAGCVCLATVTRGDAKHKERVALSGGLGRIVAAMNFHSEVASVQREACKALANLVSQSAEAKHVAASQGCVECVLDCIDSFMGAAQVVEPALFALSNFCCAPSPSPMVASAITAATTSSSKNNNAKSSKMSKNSKNSTPLSPTSTQPPVAPHVVANAIAAVAQAAARRTAIMNGGGLDLILGAIRVHVREHPGIAHAGCCALGALGGGNNQTHHHHHHSQHVSQPGTANSRTSPMKSSKSNVLISSRPSSPAPSRPSSPLNTPTKNKMNNSPPGSPLNILMFSSSPLTSPNHKLLNNHHHNSDVFLIENVQHEFGADTIRENIRKEGGLRAVVDAMLFHPHHFLVQLHGCLALAVLWRFPHGKSALASAATNLKHLNQQGGRLFGSSSSNELIEAKREQALDEEILCGVIPETVKVIHTILSTINTECFDQLENNNPPLNPSSSGATGSHTTRPSSASHHSTLDLTQNIPLVQAACLAVTALSRAHGKSRFLFAKYGVVDLVVTSVRVFAISGGKITKLKPGPVASATPKVVTKVVTKTQAINATPATVGDASSVVHHGSAVVAVAALEAIGALASLGCSEETPLIIGSKIGIDGSGDVGNIRSSFMEKDGFENMNNNDIGQSFDSTASLDELFGVNQSTHQKSINGSEDHDIQKDFNDEENVYMVSSITSAIPLVISTMRAHMSNADVQRVGCLALEGFVVEASTANTRTLLLAENDKIKNASNKKKHMTKKFEIATPFDIHEVILRSGGVDVINEAKRYHPNENVIFRVGYEASLRTGKWK